MKSVASLLICAVVLLAVGSTKAFAQNVGRAAVAGREQRVTGAQAMPGHELKTVFAEELAKHKAGAASAADSKRLAKGWLHQSNPKHSSSFSRKDAFLVVVLIVVIVGLAIVLEHNGVRSVVRCEDDPLAPDCVP